jgi:hypothetical protein
MTLKQIIAVFTCDGCRDGLKISANGNHIMYCNTPGCKPGVGEGHPYSCTSLAENKKFIKAVRACFKSKVQSTRS